MRGIECKSPREIEIMRRAGQILADVMDRLREFVEPGMAFVGRTARMDDAIRACRALWSEEPPVTFTSPTISFSELWCEPRPVQARLPIWYGGALTPPMIDRIAELGDGWLPLGPTVEEIADGIGVLRAAFVTRGRDVSGLGVRVGVPVVTDSDGRADAAASVASVADLGAIGVTAVSVALGRFIQTRADIEPFFREMVAAMRG